MSAGWIVGPVVSTLTLVGLTVVWLGIFASGGGLILAALAAILAGAAVAVRVDARHRARNAAITTLYVTGLLAAYLAFIESRPLPPGMSRGGATVPMPQSKSVFDPTSQPCRGDAGCRAQSADQGALSNVLGAGLRRGVRRPSCGQLPRAESQSVNICPMLSVEPTHL